MTIAQCAALTRLYADATSTDLSDTNFLLLFNAAQEWFGAQIIQSVGKYQFDDKNWTNLPRGPITLTEGVSKYTVTDAFLDVEQVSVKDVNGDWHVLTPIDPREYLETAIEEAFAATGLPTHYDKIENTFFLYPAPTATQVTLSGGLYLKFKRTTYTITQSDLDTGTLVPGIATPYHETVCKRAARGYCRNYKPERVPQLDRDLEKEISEAKMFYALRGKDNVNRINPAQHSNK